MDTEVIVVLLLFGTIVSLLVIAEVVSYQTSIKDERCKSLGYNGYYRDVQVNRTTVILCYNGTIPQTDASPNVVPFVPPMFYP